MGQRSLDKKRLMEHYLKLAHAIDYPPEQKYINYVSQLQRGLIPARCPRMPDLLSMNAFSLRILRDACIKMGLWVCVDKQWTRKLAKWIGKRSVLEIMAGGGWISKALQDHGIKVTATDSKSRAWSTQHNQIIQWPDLTVRRFAATTAVKRFSKADILLVSWPPYKERAIVEALNLWGTKRPIIYIGEGEGGCTACDMFFSHFTENRHVPTIHMEQWPGIHDRIMIGMWDGLAQ